MSKKTYILDTNVLVHDPESVFHFEENEVVIPFEALEELDRLKKRYDHTGRNARQAIRILNTAVEGGGRPFDRDDEGGVRLDSAALRGMEKPGMPPLQDGAQFMDNRIIALAWHYKQKYNGNTVFVSKDINARVKALALGIRAEDYEADGADAQILYSGQASLLIAHEQMERLHQTGELPLDLLGPEGAKLVENQCLLLTSPKNASALAINKSRRLRRVDQPAGGVWGIRARNKEQQFAVELLTDNTLQAVTLVGQAGTGKTLLALAVGLHKTLEEGLFSRIIFTKPVIPVGKQDIGFLPGDKEQKMLPWVQSIFDNFACLSKGSQKTTVDYLMAADLLCIESISHMRGRSLTRSWIIVEESQNLTHHEIKTVLSRVGEGSKVVLTGDICQIDAPGMDAGSNGLSYVVERLKGQPLYGHITLTRTIRSPLAALAAELL
jgi:PhoH-like ATPase